MPLPRAMAAFNKHVTNNLTPGFAARLPGFAVVSHVGRVSGRTYRTPVNMFRRGSDYVFVMTYGPNADWVKNVDAAGACDVTTRGRTVRLVAPHHYTDTSRGDVPALVAAVLRLIDVDEFMAMSPVPG
jgi:deazaflavin-dependent oxidoreductase (nitroreductase family)